MMAKRRADDTLLLSGSPSKKCCHSVCSVDVQLGSMDTTGGLSPPSLLALLGSRSRKRPYYFEDSGKQQQEQREASLHRKSSHCDNRKHATNVCTEHTSESFQDRRSLNSALTSSIKRPREECTGSVTFKPKETDTADEDANSEDCTYNSFQYWRVPLCTLDLSLLGDASDHFQTEDKSKVKDSLSDAMEN